jgi:hypothetical protein
VPHEVGDLGAQESCACAPQPLRVAHHVSPLLLRRSSSTASSTLVEYRTRT